jgi:hypothetical protein
MNKYEISWTYTEAALTAASDAGVDIDSDVQTIVVDTDNLPAVLESILDLSNCTIEFTKIIKLSYD